jgi:hypothetical protein
VQGIRNTSLSWACFKHKLRDYHPRINPKISAG